MSVIVEEDFKRWTAKRKAALVMDIIQGSLLFQRHPGLLICRLRRSSNGSKRASGGWRMPCGQAFGCQRAVDRQLKELQEAYGEAMLELRARKKLNSLLNGDEK